MMFTVLTIRIVEFLRAGKVGQALRVDVDFRARLRQRPGCARVVKMDVRQENVPDVAGAQAMPGQCGFECRESGVGAALDEHHTGFALDQKGGDGIGVAQKVEV